MGLNYYNHIKETHLSNLLRQINIKNENHFMVFSDYSWKDCPDTGVITGACIIFYKVVPIYHGTHFPVPVS